MNKVFLRWLSKLFGIMDIVELIDGFINNMKLHKQEKDRETKLNEDMYRGMSQSIIYFDEVELIKRSYIITNDFEIRKYIKPVDNNKNSPYWYYIRLFKGKEIFPRYCNTKEEYWVCVSTVFIMPIIPIPIYHDEMVIKIGTYLPDFYKYFSKNNHSIIDYKEKYTHCISEKTNIKFKKSRIEYKKVEIRSCD